MENLHTKKTSNGSNFGWLIRQMSINQKSGRQTFRRRFVSGSLFVSPCPPECYLQSETKIEPDLRLMGHRILQLAKTTQTARDEITKSLRSLRFAPSLARNYNGKPLYDGYTTSLPSLEPPADQTA